jgi:Spy/CpxP family protein refolding chaperone
MKKRIILIAVVIAVAALAVAPLVLAGPGGHGRHGFGHGHGGIGMFGHLGKLKNELDLSDGQVDQIKGIFKEAHEQNAQYREELHGGFMGVAEVLLANPNDIAGAQAVLDRQAAAERAIKASLLNATAKAIGVLNAEQRTKLANHLAERRVSHRERRGR